MNYIVKLQFEPDDLIQAYCDNQGIPIKDCDLSVEEILEQEVTSWLDASGIHVESVKEV